METKRATKDIQTTNGHKIVVYSYATGGECNAISSTYLDGAKITVVAGITNVDGIKPTSDDAVKDKKVTLLVVSVDGNSTDVLKAVNDLQHEDYDEVLTYLDKITKKKIPQSQVPK